MSALLEVVWWIAVLLVSVWALGVVLIALTSAIDHREAYDEASRRRAARHVLRAPLWPLDATRALVRYSRQLRADARPDTPQDAP